MKTTLILLFATLFVSACNVSHEPPKQVQSTFKDSETCQNQLKDMVSHSFNLRGIPASALIFNVEAKNDNEERIDIHAQKTEQTDETPIGQFKVLKNEKQIFDSTFDDSNLIKVDLKNHQNFIDRCFAKN